MQQVWNTGNLKVGMRCEYQGERRPKGSLGTITGIRKGQYLEITWDLFKESPQVYSIRRWDRAYVWKVVVFDLKQETHMQIVKLLTIAGNGVMDLTIEVTPEQAKVIENSDQGIQMLKEGSLSLTKAIKQGGEYFAMNPLTVTLPKESEDPCVCT